MVNMILRDPAEGANVYAKIVNGFFLRKDTAVAHRNRIEMLIQRLEAETKRIAHEHRPLRILNVGCGPAHEVERFIKTSDCSPHCDFDLLDFNAETIAYAKNRLEAAMRESGHSPGLHFIHKSIHDLLKEATREAAGRGSANIPPEYDLVYCAGLFDYLSDKVCSRLLQLFYRWTVPGGLVVATNVHPSNSLRRFMDYVVDWHLVYRTEADMTALAPGIGAQQVCSDTTGVNVFLDIRKEVPR